MTVHQKLIWCRQCSHTCSHAQPGWAHNMFPNQPQDKRNNADPGHPCTPMRHNRVLEQLLARRCARLSVPRLHSHSMPDLQSSPLGESCRIHTESTSRPVQWQCMNFPIDRTTGFRWKVSCPDSLRNVYPMVLPIHRSDQGTMREARRGQTTVMTVRSSTALRRRPGIVPIVGIAIQRSIQTRPEKRGNQMDRQRVGARVEEVA